MPQLQSKRKQFVQNYHFAVPHQTPKMTQQKNLPQGKMSKVCFRELIPEIPATTFGSFGLYRYPAKFIPQVIAYILKTYKKSKLTILDPFAGCGTTGLVSRIKYIMLFNF